MAGPFPPLDLECERCEGAGDVPSRVKPHLETCYACGGLGRIPTPFGQAVLAFLTDRLRITARYGEE
jgi:DnaJ-class molecular chaperone